MNIRVAIFEDNNNLREGLFQLVNGSDGFECVGAYPNCNNLVFDLSESKPHVILMDIEMPGMGGIEAVKVVKDKFPGTKILMETIFEDNNKIFQSICNGAEGYILKNTPPVLILSSIREIYEGGAPMTPSIASKVLKMFKATPVSEQSDDYGLTLREQEILKYLVEGMSYKLIADACFISSDTVSGHIKSIYRKLQVHSKGEAVAKAIRGRIV